MSAHRTWSSWVSATQNGNYNWDTCQPRAHHSQFRRALPAIHEPLCAITLEPPPEAQANASYNMPTRRLLAEAHRAMFPESRQLGRNDTAMDTILDHRLLISVESRPADGRHRSPVRRNCALGCKADVNAYWAQQKRWEFVSPRMNTKPPVSAERSTMAWPPNLDGDEVWDRAS